MDQFALINKITEKQLSRDHTFFSNPNRYRQWAEDKTTLDPSKISDISLECIGYGEFFPIEIVDRFTDYLGGCIRDTPSLKNLKLKINGFDLKECPKLIPFVCKVIDKIPPNKLKLLQFQTTRLVNCDIVQDFENIFRTAIRLGRRQRQGPLVDDNPFQTLILQFADWQFVFQDVKSQPNLETLKNVQGMIEEEQLGAEGYCFKKFRLEMSTWYYTQKEADIFFHVIKVADFHEAIKCFLNTSYNFMHDLQYFQLDLRNWHSDFQLSKLRDILMMIPKAGAQNMSLDSIKMSRKQPNRSERNSKVSKNQNDDDEIIHFERHIVI